MTFWEYLNARENRKMAINGGRPRIDARGWIGIGVYLLNLIMIGAMVQYPALRNDEFFKTITTLITGAFIKDVVGWAYQATKGGSELAERNSRMIEDQARSSGIDHSQQG